MEFFLIKIFIIFNILHLKLYKKNINIRVFGQKETSYSIEIYILDSEDFKITCPEFSNSSIKLNLKNNYTGLEIAVNGFYQFGGISDDGSLVNNDLYYLDSSSKWNYIDIYGEKQNARYGMIMIAFNQ